MASLAPATQKMYSAIIEGFVTRTRTRPQDATEAQVAEYLRGLIRQGQCQGTVKIFHVFTSSRLHVFTFSRLHVFTSSRLHLFTSAAWHWRQSGWMQGSMCEVALPSRRVCSISSSIVVATWWPRAMSQSAGRTK
jgi:hypothetical protein